ncbi:DUF3667 domain-containing protein [Mucilaginibacter paludis]|uniref:DUF3667 domain-containing protein n=1 Tax=Mucilaginibacter paludis DSM 18603 TaxID=714943 RepID=H1Y0X6_9SPHI|nr:DUF3667 domain-containing protein [Mucilaginibacter paludis]EHQ29201.1 hypothetical protein Mucpa_5126 [Mucilaginibacter paludis DSM 18603]
MKKHHRHENDCLNCGTELQGHFCHVCGQENLQLKEPFWHFLSHSISHYFHFDSKFFSTLRPLLTKPGQLTLDYLAGRRTRYLHPVSMYIFVSIVYFLVIPKLEHRLDRQEENEEQKSEEVAKYKPAPADTLGEAQKSIDEAPLGGFLKGVAKKSIQKISLKQQGEQFKLLPFNRQTQILDSLKKVNQLHPNQANADKIETYADAHILKEDSTYASYLKRQQLLPEGDRDNFYQRFTKQRDIEIKLRTNKEWSLDKEIEHYQPKLYFILMPLFALFLMINFRRDHKYYVEYLVFTIHCFTAFFIFEVIVEPLNYLLLNDESTIFNVLRFAAILWYSYTALITCYQRPKRVTIRKMITLGIMLFIAFKISYEIIHEIVYLTA